MSAFTAASYRKKKKPQTLEKVFFNKGLVRQDVFEQEFPNFDPERVAAFYRNNPVARQFYGGKRQLRSGQQQNFSPYPLARIHIDLAEFRPSEFPFCLVCVCNYSRYAWTRKLASKSGRDIAEALEPLCALWKRDRIVPSHSITLLGDMGAEFKNPQVNEVLQRHGIAFYQLSSSLSKASFAEAFIKTLRMKLNTLHHYKPQASWHSLLDTVTKIYNSTPHTGIFMLTPEQVYKRNDPEVIRRLEDKKRLKVTVEEAELTKKAVADKTNLAKLDYVRLMRLKDGPFAKQSETSKITREVFFISEIKPANTPTATGRGKPAIERPPMYQVTDLTFEPIKGCLAIV